MPNLRMRFAPNIIEHLGVRMYSTFKSLPPVISELIANSYDADASRVLIHLKDSADPKEIVIQDDGHGMSFDEINENFLTIGRNRRQEGDQVSPHGRKVIGKKGLGKLAFFGIAHKITIQTVKDGKKNIFTMDWKEIIGKSDGNGMQDYNPEIIQQDQSVSEENGTTIILCDIQRKSEFDPEALANGIARHFILNGDFQIELKYNNEESILIDEKRRYSQLEELIGWSIPKDVNLKTTYSNQEEIKGRIFTTEKPISPKTNMRGITLFSRKKLVNAPEYFSDSTSGYFFSYLTGWLEVDFIDDLDEDVIGTTRQSLNWNHPEMVELREYLKKMLKWLEHDWRQKISKIKRDKLNERLKDTDIKDWQDSVPENLSKSLTPILNIMLEHSELPDKDMESVVRNLRRLIPPYPVYHWRGLHPSLNKAVLNYYKEENYYTAVFEGVKLYVAALRKKTKSILKDKEKDKKKLAELELFEYLFQQKPRRMSVTGKYKKTNGDDFMEDTMSNIESGHRELVIAMWKAFRNPIAHETVSELRESRLYTEKDCLDALGLLSHLFRRLEDLEPNK